MTAPQDILQAPRASVSDYQRPRETSTVLTTHDHTTPVIYSPHPGHNRYHTPAAVFVSPKRALPTRRPPVTTTRSAPLLQYERGDQLNKRQPRHTSNSTPASPRGRQKHDSLASPTPEQRATREARKTRTATR